MERLSTPPIANVAHCLARTVTPSLSTHAGDPELAWARTNVGYFALDAVWHAIHAGADPATFRTVPEWQEMAVVMDPAGRYEGELYVASWETPAYGAAVSSSGGLSHPDLAPCDLQERQAGFPDVLGDMVTTIDRAMEEEG